MVLKVVCRPVSPFATNAYLLIDEATREAVLVDPGDEVPALLQLIESERAEVQYIVGTHGHLDHAAGVAQAKRELEVDYYLHEGDRDLLEGLPMQARMFGMGQPEVPAIDRFLQEGDSLMVGKTALQVLHAPGHSPGSVCLYDGGSIVVVGDVLFAGSIGRTDLLGGIGPQLMNSIQTQLLTLPDEVEVFTGHGPATTIGRERRSNPFVSGQIPFF